MKNLIEVILCGSSGRMGREIISAVSDRNDFVISSGVDVVRNECCCFDTYETIFDVERPADVIIDFSSNTSLDMLLEYGVREHIPIVLCTTGYSREQVEKIRMTSSKIPIFYSSNMSLGVNLLIELSKIATKVLGTASDICIIEKHHKYKKDSPSGTALMLDEAIRSVKDKKVDINSVRAGNIVGEHEVLFVSNNEIVTLKHSAASKEIFANGALNAAKFLLDKENGLYDMNCLLFS